MDFDIKDTTKRIHQSYQESRERRNSFQEGQSVVINDPSSDDIGKEGKIVGINESRSASLDVKLKGGEVISISPDLLDDKDSEVSFDDIVDNFRDAID